MSENKLDSQLQSFFDGRDELWGCKDQDSRFIYVNQAYSECIGLESRFDCQGLTDFDMPSQTVKQASSFFNQDQYVMRQGKSIQILDIHKYYDGHVRVHIFKKTPWVVSNKIKGTIFSGEEVTKNNFSRLCGLFANKAKIPLLSKDLASHNDAELRVQLSKKERMIAYYLSHGRSRQDLSQILNIKVTTVDSYLEKMKIKLNAASKKQLIDVIIQQGFMSQLPLEMLPRSFSQMI